MRGVADTDDEERNIGGKCIECNEQFEDRQSLTDHFKVCHVTSASSVFLVSS